MTTRKLAKPLFILLVLSVIFLSLTPHQPTVSISNIDKVEHFAAYFTMALVGYLFSRSTKGLGIGLFLLGLSLEVAQSFVPGRQCSVGDLIANSSGIIVGLLVSRWFFRTRKKAPTNG